MASELAASSVAPPQRSEPQSAAAPADLDLLLPLRSAGSLENPYPIYSLLRTVRPVMEMPIPDYSGPGVWMLTRYREVEQSLRDARLSVERMRAPLIRDNLERLPSFIRQSAQNMRSMLVMDPPDHTRVRKLVGQAFTPRRVAQLRPRIEQILEDLLAGVERDGGMELIHDLAEPLPAIVIAELLGVPAEDHRQFREWSSALVANIGARQRDGAASEPARHALESLLAYLSEVIAARRKQPRDDLISAMLHAQEESDVLSDSDLIATSNLILLAGHETTTNLIGNGMLALLREPDQLERLRRQPELLPVATNELLRFDGPVQATVRVALEDIELGDHLIPEGAVVLVSIGAANHDPDVFSDPDQLDIGRDPNPHLAFGFGAHFCLGSRLALLEAELVFGALVRRFPQLRLVDDCPVYRENPILRGLSALPLEF
jgi:cytochrome P450